jgi:hypothetical protein
MKPVFHEGELEVQRRAGVEAMARRIGGGIHSTIPPPAQEFIRSQRMVFAASVDAAGHVWCSALTGRPGFVTATDEKTVRLKPDAVVGDPLFENLKAHPEIGLLAIEFRTRRRMRLNGKAERMHDGSIVVKSEEVFSNCPKYIQVRVPEDGYQNVTASSVVTSERLTPAQQLQISESDTFFIATFHPGRGADVSHRGGQPGFVRVVDDNRIAFPDYSGNMMFQTLGNITANPHCGLLFINWQDGSVLQLTGQAHIVWDKEASAEFPGAERVIDYAIEAVIERKAAIPRPWRLIEYSPFNPR